VKGTTCVNRNAKASTSADMFLATFIQTVSLFDVISNDNTQKSSVQRIPFQAMSADQGLGDGCVESTGDDARFTSAV
jgi:hypothetical protein